MDKLDESVVGFGTYIKSTYICERLIHGKGQSIGTS